MPILELAWEAEIDRGIGPEQVGFVKSANLAATSAIGGAGIWVAVAWRSAGDLRGFAWSEALLLLAALVLVPLLLRLARGRDEGGSGERWLHVAQWVQVPAGLALVAAVGAPPGTLAGVLAGPWLTLTGVVAWAGFSRLVHGGARRPGAACIDAGLVFFAVGGAWTVADRLRLHPLGFGTDIVQLTAVHFHYAGLALPVLAGLAIRETDGSRTGAWGGALVLLGVPLVAAAITGAQLGLGPWLELAAGAVMAAGALIVAGLHVRLALDPRQPGLARALWGAAGGALAFGMALAFLYAARGCLRPLPWLDIPWMRALHGTANALGFGVCGVLGWWVRGRREN